MAIRKQQAQASVNGTTFNRRQADRQALRRSGSDSGFDVKKKVVELEVKIKGYDFILTDTEVRQLIKMLVDAIHKEGTPKLDRLPMKRIKKEIEQA